MSTTEIDEAGFNLFAAPPPRGHYRRGYYWHVVPRAASATVANRYVCANERGFYAAGNGDYGARFTGPLRSTLSEAERDVKFPWNCYWHRKSEGI